MASPGDRLISATGTISPSTWQVLLLKWNSVMSFMRGASRQPDSLTRLRISSGAPQERHVSAALSFMLWHHWHCMRSIGSLPITGALVIGRRPLLFHAGRAGRRDDDGRYVLFAHQAIERGQVRGGKLLVLLQLRVGFRREILVHHVRLRGRRVIGTLHYAFERRQLIVQLDGEVQRIFAAAVLGLVQLFL